MIYSMLTIFNTNPIRMDFCSWKPAFVFSSFPPQENENSRQPEVGSGTFSIVRGEILWEQQWSVGEMHFGSQKNIQPQHFRTERNQTNLDWLAPKILKKGCYHLTFDEVEQLHTLLSVVVSPFQLPPLKLTVRTWKWMVGIRSFPFGMGYFQVRTVSFRECSFLSQISYRKNVFSARFKKKPTWWAGMLGWFSFS